MTNNSIGVNCMRLESGAADFTTKSDSSHSAYEHKQSKFFCNFSDIFSATSGRFPTLQLNDE